MAGTADAREAVPVGSLQSVARPPAIATSSDHSPLHRMERSSRMRNRMRESCTSGSVGGEGGNLLVYPALQKEWPEVSVHSVDVVVVDHGGGTHQPRIRHASLRV